MRKKKGHLVQKKDTKMH